MKRITILFILLQHLGTVFSQGAFQKNLDVLLEAPLIRVAPDGKHFYLVNLDKTNGSKKIQIYKIDAQGNIIWQLEKFSAVENIELKAIAVVSDGLLVLLSAYVSEKQSNGFVLKFDTIGGIVWNREIGTKNLTQLFDFQEDNTGSIWLSGLHFKQNATDSSYYFLTKLTPEGFPIQSAQNAFRYFPYSLYESCKYTDLTWDQKNGTLTYVEDFDCPFSNSGISALNRGRFALGYCKPNFQFNEYFCDTQFSVLENTQKFLIFSGYSTFFNQIKDKPLIGIIDASGKQEKIARLTPGLFVPIHSLSDDIVFYAKEDKTLTKFNDELLPIWTIKLDNCSVTTAFNADIAPDGMIYTVRNINDKTVIAKVLPDGSLSACNSYPRKSPELPVREKIQWVSYYPGGYIPVPMPDTIHAFTFIPKSGLSKDYCVRIDAYFELPDTICLGARIKPASVDTSPGNNNTWDILNIQSDENIPEIYFPDLGRIKVVHRVQNTICSDVESRFVQVVEAPQITAQDTLVCGPGILSLDIGKNATAFYLDGDLVSSPVMIGQSGIYSLEVENKGCNEKKDIEVKIVEFPPAINAIDSTYCFGDTVRVALNNSFDAVFWDNKPFQDSFVLIDANIHSYRARYKPDSSCMVSGEIRVPRKRCNAADDFMFIPNAFKPDSQEENHLFQVFPKASAQIMGVKIFDRWGNLCAQWAGAGFGWDGTFRGEKAAPGIYTYFIEYLDLSNPVRAIRSGEVLLVR